MTHYDKTLVTFHRGNAFAPEGMEAEPFATFIINDIVDREVIESLCAIMRDHVHMAHADFCNIKISTEDWDC